jgi:lipopolysaccharide export system protein LptA
LLARGSAVAILTAALVVCALAAQTPTFLFETLPAADNTQPVQLNADTIATWKVAGKQIFRLRGNVVVTQGQNAIRTPDCVVWVDLPANPGDSVLTLTIYGENSISLDRNNAGQAPAQADYGYVRTVTTSKVDIKPFKDKLVEQDQSTDPVYQRALQKRPAELLQGPTGVDTGLRLASALQPLPAPPLPAPPPPPPALDPSKNPMPAPPLKQDVYFQPMPEPNAAPAPGATPAPPPPVFSSTVPQPDPPPGTPAKPAPHLSVRPRYGDKLDVDYKPVADGWTAIIVSGGVITFIDKPGESSREKAQVIDIEADRLVIWTKGNAQQLVGNMSSKEGADNGAHELYLSGHVAMRTRGEKDIKTVRANELYYDVRRNVAVAREADFEIVIPKALFPLHVKTPELQQLGPKLWSMKQSDVFSSFIPSDPGLIFNISNMTIEERQYELSYLYGLWPAYDKDGKRMVQTDHVFTGNNYLAYLEGLPVFYFPYFRGRVEDPLGPLDSVNAGYDTLFGFQLHTTWDLYDIFDLPHFDGTKWQLYLDYLTERGPGFGTYFDFSGKDPFGIKGKYNGEIKLYGMVDHGFDTLGGNRGLEEFWPNPNTAWPVNQPEFRGWAYGRVNVQELPDGFSYQGQFAFLSDRNFQEVYFLNDHLNGPNNDTYLHFKQQQNNWALTLDATDNTQDWFTHTNWLPKADGYLMGQSFSFGQLEDLFVFNTHASAGYAELRPTIQVPFAYLPTDVRVNTARLDWMSDLSMPFDAGPFKIAPYITADAAYYSQDVNGDSIGRVYGGGGVRWSMPLSKLYPDIQSDLLNINEIYHKIVMYGNYFAAQSSTSNQNLPQLNRLDDDTTDQTLRDIRPQQSLYNPNYNTLLTTSNLFNPQFYALRRLVDNSPDNLDTMNVLQLGIDQRWQTQRGFPGDYHIVDWMSLNVQASIYPHSERDDLGHTLGILEYNWAWNIGDRTALTSSGFFEPFNAGCRAFQFGAILGRPDSTNVYIGYQQIDPLNSKAIIASVAFPISAKYAVTANTVWDFGDNVSSYSLFLSRMGTDVVVNFGLSFNSTLNTVSLAFEVLPNVARNTGHSAGLFPGLPMTNVDSILNQK